MLSIVSGTTFQGQKCAFQKLSIPIWRIYFFQIQNLNFTDPLDVHLKYFGYPLVHLNQVNPLDIVKINSVADDMVVSLVLKLL